MSAHFRFTSGSDIRRGWVTQTARKARANVARASIPDLQYSHALLGTQSTGWNCEKNPRVKRDLRYCAGSPIRAGGAGDTAAANAGFRTAVKLCQQASYVLAGRRKGRLRPAAAGRGFAQRDYRNAMSRRGFPESGVVQQDGAIGFDREHAAPRRGHRS